MSTFTEAEHPRTTTGKFAEKTGRAPAPLAAPDAVHVEPMTMTDAPVLSDELRRAFAGIRDDIDPLRVSVVRAWEPHPVSAVNRAGGVWVTYAIHDDETVYRAQLGGLPTPDHPEIARTEEWSLVDAPARERSSVISWLTPLDQHEAQALRFGQTHGFD